MDSSFHRLTLCASLAAAVGAVQPMRAQTLSLYAGGVINSGLPNEPGRLTILLIDSGAPPLKGYLWIGDPLGGSGPFRAARSADSLFLGTTSNTGDTIVWISPHGDQFIGGSYRITGGPYKGQGGVWSASMFLTVPSLKPVARVPLELVDQSSEPTGRAFVYLVREAFRQAPGFRLSELEEPRYQVSVQTQSDSAAAPAVTYVVVVTYLSGTKASGWNTRYLYSTLGRCSGAPCSRTARDLAAGVQQYVARLYGGLLASVPQN